MKIGWTGAPVFLEIVGALAFWIVLREILRAVDFSAWQIPIFGAALVTSTLLFFSIPWLMNIFRSGTPFSDICDFSQWKKDLLIGAKAIRFIFPATVVFPVVGLVGSTQEDWLGALMLTGGFLLAGWFYIRKNNDVVVPNPVQTRANDLKISIGFILGSLFVCFLVTPYAPLLSRAVQMLVFVGFLEEFFFRGYIQSRFNAVFGKPFRYRGVGFGWGLVFAALIFGLFHPITVLGSNPWPWALWTAALGLVLGYLREKTGSVIAPAILHGVIVLPTIFLVPS